ncbi:hypothetical protein MRX96_036976 [Rhipicephalus microplus]
MEDMAAFIARLGSTRPPSCSQVVQVRCRGSLFALALTGFAVALLSQLNTAKASAYDSTRPRSGVQEKLEVTRSEGDNDVEYCYENDEANTTEALEQCAQHSSMLMDIAKTDVLIENKLHDIIRFYQESWVDIKQEDVSELSGVFSKNFAEIDWNASCTTVWFKRGVPWFFVRNCSDLYPVLCEASDASTREWERKE